MTSQLNMTFLEATWVIDVIVLFHDMLSMNVCPIGHRQTSG